MSVVTCICVHVCACVHECGDMYMYLSTYESWMPHVIPAVAPTAATTQLISNSLTLVQLRMCTYTAMHTHRVGQNRIYAPFMTVYLFGAFPAHNTVYTLFIYIYGSGHTLHTQHAHTWLTTQQLVRGPLDVQSHKSRSSRALFVLKACFCPPLQTYTCSGKLRWALHTHHTH